MDVTAHTSLKTYEKLSKYNDLKNVVSEDNMMTCCYCVFRNYIKRSKEKWGSYSY